MAFNFKAYEGATLEQLGILSAIAGVGGSLRFTNKSLNGKGQLCVVITKKDGTSDTCTCSKAVTDTVRTAIEAGTSKKDVLGAIAKLAVIEATNGGNYVSAPMNSEGVESFTITELKAVKVTYEELQAF